MDYKQFLDKIKLIESSGGVDTDHETVDYGIHKGSSAYGNYGLMPNTIREMAKRQRMSNTERKEVLPFEKMDDDSIKEKLKENPELEEYFAERVAEHILNRQQGNIDKSAFAWNQGHNLYPEKIDEEKLNKSDYVKKFRNLKNMLVTKGE